VALIVANLICLFAEAGRTRTANGTVAINPARIMKLLTSTNIRLSGGESLGSSDGNVDPQKVQPGQPPLGLDCDEFASPINFLFCTRTLRELVLSCNFDSHSFAAAHPARVRNMRGCRRANRRRCRIAVMGNRRIWLGEPPTSFRKMSWAVAALS
jgi:hypothetical protein